MEKCSIHTTDGSQPSKWRESLRLEDVVWYIAIPLVTLFVNIILTEDFSVPKHAFLSLTIVVVYLVSLVGWFRRGASSIFVSPFHLLAIAYWISTMLSILNVMRDNPYLLRRSLDVSLYVFAFTVLSIHFSNIALDRKRIEKYLLVFLISGFVVALNALLNFYTGLDIFVGVTWDNAFRTRMRSTIGNVIFVANYMTMLMPISAYFSLTRSDDPAGVASRGGKILLRTFALISSVLFYYVAIVSQVRSEYISLTVQFVIFVLLSILGSRKLEERKPTVRFPRFPFASIFGNPTLSFLVVVFTALPIIFFGPPTVLNHHKLAAPGPSYDISTRLEGATLRSDYKIRLVGWLSALKLWERHKVLGQGIGTYDYYGGYACSEVTNSATDLAFAWQLFDTPHNDYLQVLAETGTVGFTTVLALFVGLFAYALKNLAKLREAEDQKLFMALVLSFVPFAVQMFFSFPVQVPPNSLLATFVASVGIGRSLNATGSYEIKVDRRGRFIVVALLTLGLLLCSSYLRVTRFLSDAHLRKGKVALNYVNEGLAKLIDDRPTPEPNAQNREAQTSINLDFDVGVESLLTSIALNPSNGQAYYYLSAFAGLSLRVERLMRVPPERLADVLSQRYDGIQKAIGADSKQPPLSVFASERAGKSHTRELIEAQVLLDRLALLKVSLRTHTELGALEKLVETEAKLIRKLNVLRERTTDRVLGLHLEKLSSGMFEEMVETIRETLSMFGGGWVRYGMLKNLDVERATFGGEDWHLKFLNALISVGGVGPRVLEEARWIMRREVQVCDAVRASGHWALPDAGLTYAVVLAKILAESGRVVESEELVGFAMSLYEPWYRYSRGRTDARLLEESFEKVKERYVSHLRAKLRGLVVDPSGATLEKLLAEVELKFREVAAQFVSFDFKTTVGDYLAELGESLRIGRKVGLRSVWRMVLRSFTSSVFPRIVSLARNVESLGEMLAATELIFEVHMSGPMYEHERYAIFRELYEKLEALRARN